MCSTGAHIALNSIDHNLKVVEKLGVSYHNTQSLHQKVDSMPDCTGDWITRKLSFKDSPNEEFTIRYCDPFKASGRILHMQIIWYMLQKRFFLMRQRQTEFLMRCGLENGGMEYRYGHTISL